MLRGARIRVAAFAALGLSGMVSAAVLDDAANGSWDSATTWGGSVPASGDTINIDTNRVSINSTVGATINYPTTINLAGTGTLALGYGTNIPGSATLNFGGGEYEHQRGTAFSGGVTLNVAASTTTTVDNLGAGEVAFLGESGTLAVSAVVTGSGTINKIGGATWTLKSATGNTSTFSGTYQLQDGIFEPYVPQHTKYATVALVGTVAGTIAGTNLDLSPRVHLSQGGVPVATQPEVGTLTGTGRISFAGSRYYRDLAIGTLLDPGTSTEAGLIKQHGTTSNDLIMRPGSTMAFDVFSATSADKIDWNSGASSGMVFNEANLKIRLFTPTEALGSTSWLLINGDEWITKAGQAAQDAAGFTAATIADQAFASIIWQNADGSPVTLWQDGVQSGWKDLAITYGGTAGSSNRTVILSGEYVLVPEPALVSVMAGCAMLLGLRRRRA